MALIRYSHISLFQTNPIISITYIFSSLINIKYEKNLITISIHFSVQHC